MDKISKSEYDLKYYESNREKIRNRQKEHYELNKDKYAKYYNDNKENILSKQSLYHKNKRKSDSTYRFIYNLRIRQKQVLNGISSTTKGLEAFNKKVFRIQRFNLLFFFYETLIYKDYDNIDDALYDLSEWIKLKKTKGKSKYHYIENVTFIEKELL